MSLDGCGCVRISVGVNNYDIKEIVAVFPKVNQIYIKSKNLRSLDIIISVLIQA